MSVMLKIGFRFLRAGLALLTLTLLNPCLRAADTNAPTTPTTWTVPSQASETNSQLLEIIEENREMLEASTSNTLALNDRLSKLEIALTDARVAEQSNLEHSNKVVLIAAIVIAAIGILAMILAAFLQWTALNRLSAHARLLAERPPALSSLESHGLEQSSARFLGSMERLEQRLRELETSGKSPSPLLEGAVPNGKPNAPTTDSTPDTVGEINLLLNKSQTLLKLEKPEAALQCLDELLALHPENAQALINRGAALERLRRFDEAIACYDHALAQDKSMTTAYLAKGGVYRRMERYDEALACYEAALKRPKKETAVNPGKSVLAAS
jgi:tetratricopeptide (TPR) repeat protein